MQNSGITIKLFCITQMLNLNTFFNLDEFSQIFSTNKELCAELMVYVDLNVEYKIGNIQFLH